jgi:hypothetical protein
MRILTQIQKTSYLFLRGKLKPHLRHSQRAGSARGGMILPLLSRELVRDVEGQIVSIRSRFNLLLIL